MLDPSGEKKREGREDTVEPDRFKKTCLLAAAVDTISFALSVVFTLLKIWSMLHTHTHLIRS